MTNNILQLRVTLKDKRNRVLFEGFWTDYFEETINRKIITQHLKEKKAEIISSIVRSTVSNFSTLEKLGICRQMSVKIEEDEKEIIIALNP